MKIRVTILSIMALLSAAPMVAMNVPQKPAARTIVDGQTIDALNTTVIQIMEEFHNVLQKAEAGQKSAQIKARERLQELIAQVPAVTMGELKRALNTLVTNIELFNRAEAIDLKLIDTTIKSFNSVITQIQGYAKSRNLKLTLQRDGAQVKPSAIAKSAPVAPLKPSAIKPAAPQAVAPVAPLKKTVAPAVAAVQKKAAAPTASNALVPPVAPAVNPAPAPVASPAVDSAPAVVAPAPQVEPVASVANVPARASKLAIFKKLNTKQAWYAAGFTGLAATAYGLYHFFAPASAPEINVEPNVAPIDTSYPFVDTYLNLD